MSKHNLDEYFNTALKLAKESGQIIRELNYTPKTVDTKSCEVDLVTETDQRVEKLLIDGFSSQFPDHKFIGEESVASGESCVLTDDPTWIIDPIDGTMNFVHGFPHSCISIALFIDKAPAIGIIYNPVLEQMFTARKGKGAFLNDKVIKVSGQTEMSQALLMVEGGTSRDGEKMKFVSENMKKLTAIVQGTRSLGSAALDMAMVALGSADGYIECGIHIWDIAAGELLVKEAGGVVIDPAGGTLDRFSRRVLCASSQELAEKLAEKLVQFYPTPRD